MKITLRIVVSLLLVAAVVSFGFSLHQVQSEKKRLVEEYEKRAIVLADSLQSSYEQASKLGSKKGLRRLVARFKKMRAFEGVAFFDINGTILETSQDVNALLDRMHPLVKESIAEDKGVADLVGGKGGNQKYLYAIPLYQDSATTGALVLFYDTPNLTQRLTEILYNNMLRFMVLSFLLIFTTILVVRWSITGPIAQVSDWLKEFRSGKSKDPPSFPRGDILGPLAIEINSLAKSVAMARAVSEEKERLTAGTESLWTSERLKEHVKNELGKKSLFVVSNREPYMHVKKGSRIECVVPAGGLVTALDPVLKACGGVWVAQGMGDGDREAADAKGRLKVPPGEELYSLRRVWLSKEEEEGFYYGLSNEGLWPLCHITHTRPSFRLEDWVHYQKVNEKFAEVLLDEIANEDSPLVLIQDYHFVLLPLLIKRKRPDAHVGIFWHIPWPNPEVFGICPWREEVLLGLLGADLIGFHTQFHCNNFLEGVDRFLESKVDWEQFSVERNGHVSFVKPFPISVAPSVYKAPENPGALKESILKELGVKAEFLGLGVDRIDYTKGIKERFSAVERFLEKDPSYIGRFTFIELGAPSRTLIKPYRELISDIEETAEKINWRFQGKDWKPIIFLKDHHSHEKIHSYYRVADLCMVTSLHDGMNLVAKEYVASREDETGVLILSQFTGASRELGDALLVNPYSIEEMAGAILMGLQMDGKEKSLRMKRMRKVVSEKNVYYWAANLITTLARLRIQ